jgi:soluble lytic murein transglycosylase-like protein
MASGGISAATFWPDFAPTQCDVDGLAGGFIMQFRVVACAAFVAACAFVAAPAGARDLLDSNGNLDALISKHAAANNVPESLVRRVIKRESGGRAHVISKGNYGIMQIRLGTARGMGYRGDVRGLLDADTNMTYAVKYLANAYRVAGGDQNRAVALYAGGYYYAAKRKGMLEHVDPNAGLARADAVKSENVPTGSKGVMVARAISGTD